MVVGASHGRGEVRAGDTTPDLSIVTINYNSGDVIGDCLRAVFENTRSLRIEYFVVDNASRPDGTLERIADAFPDVDIVRNATNLGFAAGCNVALARATGRFVLLLNPDTTVRPEALYRMVAFLEGRPDVAVLGSPLVGPDGRDQGVAGRGFPTPLAALFGRTTLLTRVFGPNRFSSRFSSSRDPTRTAPYECDWVSGACMMVRRDAIEQVGMLDPGYFFMWEDADWCFRMKRAGWRVYCSHEAGVVHREGSSRGRGWRPMWIGTVGFHRGAYRYYRQHIHDRPYSPVHVAVMAGLAGRAVLVFAGRAVRALGAGTSGTKRKVHAHHLGRDGHVQL
jgi:N-acetylglucosaminyl-diphospho-decaprenol L-rhamnosyltransferase